MISPLRPALLVFALLAQVACAHTSSQVVASRGAALFAKNCAACHGDHGLGPIGPSLARERTKRTAQEIRAIITNPDPPMPKLYPRDLTDADVADLAAFVETL